MKLGILNLPNVGKSTLFNAILKLALKQRTILFAQLNQRRRCSRT